MAAPKTKAVAVKVKPPPVKKGAVKPLTTPKATFVTPKKVVAPSKTPPPPKATDKTVKTPIVNKATGFTVGTKSIAATKSNPKTTSTPLAQAKRVAAARKGPFEQVGDFIANRVGQMTGEIATPISGAMKNKTPVIPYTQKNIKAIKKASGK
jgi:hypothetical protein